MFGYRIVMPFFPHRRRCEDKQGLWVTTVEPVSMAWIPKETSSILVDVLEATCRAYKFFQVDLAKLARHVHWGNLDAGRAATAANFPNSSFRHCLRHQLDAIKRRHGSPEDKDLVTSAIHLSNSFGFSPHVFHMVWETTLLKLGQAEALDRSGWSTLKPPFF